VKRGWITWDQSELPPAALERRLAAVARVLAGRDLPALILYTDVCRSNHGRYFANFMPYWNRSLLVVPREVPPILLCPLSPRVYPWIRSISIVQDIRPGAALVQSLAKLCAEKGWKKIGVLDLASLPHDLHARLGSAGVEAEDVPSSQLYAPGADDWEIGLRRRAATLAREALARQLPQAAGARDWELVGRLERDLRLAGAEDAVILVSHGDAAPSPAKGLVLGEAYSVTLALEYRGHWAKLSRPHAPAPVVEALRKQFEETLRNLATNAPARAENLAGAYPYESCDPSELSGIGIFAVHVESSFNQRRLFYGDTCRWGETGAEPL